MADSPLGRADDLPGPSVLGFLACGAVARRSAFLEAKGFDDLIFFFGEEELLSLDLMAAGWGLAYVDEVVAHHHPAPSRGPSPARAALGARNRVLTALMRRPWPTVATTVGKELRAGGPRAQGVAHALPRTPRALARRQLLPPHVEAARLLLSGGAAR
jgi:GT2 family glycosyltransferase